jgi:mannose-6-phosphate isomerase-like protein (cupin superfamily)
MYHASLDLPQEQRPNMRGGDGAVLLSPAFASGDYAAPLRLFSRITLPAGASIGYHVHEQEEEFFYFLSGTGIMDDNGTPVAVKAGDSTVTRSGEGHALRNTGEDPLELLAVIVRT